MLLPLYATDYNILFPVDRELGTALQSTFVTKLTLKTDFSRSVTWDHTQYQLFVSQKS